MSDFVSDVVLCVCVCVCVCAGGQSGELKKAKESRDPGEPAATLPWSG